MNIKEVSGERDTDDEGAERANYGSSWRGGRGGKVHLK